MCTAITLVAKNGDVIFGRTMDFSYPLHPTLHKIPGGYSFQSQTGFHTFCTKYPFMGTAQTSPALTFADGINSAGLSAAMLYFPGYASYDDCNPKEHRCIAATEVVLFTLGMCKNVSDVIATLSNLSIIGIKDNVTHTIAPLHWIFADKSGRCITVEKTSEGIHFYENQNGVLTNSPDFSWHQTNLRNYIHLSQEQTSSVAWNGKWLTPFGQAGGSIGLLGDFTSPGRFVRAAFLKSHLAPLNTGTDAIAAAFSVLGNVTIPKGCVMTKRMAFDYTLYTVCYHLSTLQAYYKNCEDIPMPVHLFSS